MTAEKKSYPVWVGSLKEEITEQDLFDAFKCYGPICNVRITKTKQGKSRGFGFVNFYSKEVAEVAASDMDDTEICSSTIKASFKDESKKARDLRPLIDCNTFMERKPCTAGKICIFRHNKAAREQGEICKDWLDKSCDEISCVKRHPQTEHAGDDERKSGLTRCNSHDRYKCFGQCGNPSCGKNHYCDRNALEKHIAGDVDAASLICKECGAVFFSLDEKAKHNHSTPSKVKQPRRKSKDTTSSDQQEPIGIYWDIENCMVPNGKSAQSIVKKIRDQFLGGRKLIDFICVCDTSKLPTTVIDGLNHAEITVVHIKATAKNAADDKLKQHMQKFGQTFHAPATVLLISGDVNFAPVLHDLRYTSNFQILLLHNVQASQNFIQFAHAAYRFDIFIADLPDMFNGKPVQGTNNVANPVRTTEVLVKNLPFHVPEGMVITRLSSISDNCGGRVQPLIRDNIAFTVSCVVRFPTADKADRALIRMQNEDVCGSKIEVCEYWGEVASQFGTAQSATKAHRAQRLGRGSQLNASQNMKPAGRPTNMRKTMSMGALHSSDPYQMNFPVGLFNPPRQLPPVVQGNILPTPKSTAAPQKASQKSAVTTTKSAANIPKPVVVVKSKSVSVAQKSLLPTPVMVPPQAVTQSKDDITKSKVCSILQEIPHWMALHKFCQTFKKKFKEEFDICQLERFKDVVYVDGKPGKKFVCLLFVDISSILFEVETGKFHEELTNILILHNRKVPFTCLLGLYWSYQGRVLRFSNAGISLKELVLSCPNVSSKNGVYLMKSVLGKQPELGELIQNVIQMLQCSPHHRIPFDTFAQYYINFFGVPLYVKRSGFSGVQAFLNAFPDNAVEMKEEGGATFVKLTNEYKRKLHLEHISQMLLRTKGHQINLNNLAAEFYKFFGTVLIHDSRIQRVTAFVGTFKENFKIFTTKDKRRLLTFRKAPQQDHSFQSSNSSCPIPGPIPVAQSQFQSFKNSLVSLLKSKPDGMVALENLENEFQDFHGTCPQLAELGFEHPNDLFEALKDKVTVVDKDGVKCIRLNTRFLQKNKSWNQILNILQTSKFNAVLLRDLNDAMKKDISANIATPPGAITVLGSNRSTCFVLSSKIKDLKANDNVTAVCKILYASPAFSLTVQEILDKLDGTEEERRKALMDTSETGWIKVEGTRLVLDRVIAKKLFGDEVVSLLLDLPEKSTTIAAMCGQYHKRYGRQYKLAEFGCKKALELFTSVPNNVIEVEMTSNAEGGLVKLGKLGNFIEETMILLLENKGAVLLNQLLDFHRKKFEAFTVKDTEFANLTLIFKYYSHWFTLVPIAKHQATLLILKEYLSSNAEEMPQEKLSKPLSAKLKQKHEYAHSVVKSKSESSVSSQDDLSSEDDSVVIESEELYAEMPALEDQGNDSQLSQPMSDSVHRPTEDEVYRTNDTVLSSDKAIRQLEKYKRHAFNAADDLLDFSDTDSVSNNDWWMTDIPDSVPNPELEPQPATWSDTHTVYDLISLDDSHDDIGQDDSIFESLDPAYTMSNLSVNANKGVNGLDSLEKELSSIFSDQASLRGKETKKRHKKIAAKFGNA